MSNGFLPGREPAALSEAVNSTVTVSKRDLSRLGGPFTTHAGARDMDVVFGYPDVIRYEDAFKMYQRMGIATRLTRGVARSCWRDMPTVEVDDKPILEDEIIALNKRKLFRKLENADTLNRIGKFSVMFVGVSDGEQDLANPLGKASGADAMSQLFFQAYGESGVEVTRWVTEPTDPRFGLPLVYQLTVRDVTDNKLPSATATRNVHFSRVVHLAEDALDNDIEGLSALTPVYNFLLDLIKTEGGSSEAYWRNARRVLAFNAKEGFGNASDKVLEQLRTDIEEFTNGWRDGLRLGGVEVTQFPVEHADPKEAVLACLKLISGTTGIPLRILTGEGGGQTTGNEDKAAYNQLIKDRQEMMCSDWLMQTLDILANADIIDAIPDNAIIVWPETEALNELEKSTVAKNNAEAFAAVADAINPISGGFAGSMSPEQAAREFLDIDDLEIVTDDGLDDDELIGLPGVETEEDKEDGDSESL